MDLVCLDLGCISVSGHKLSNDHVSPDSEKRREVDSSESSSSPNARVGKNKSPKEVGSANFLNKLTSQIKKPPHRRSSPLNWFPRIKVEPYLKRKIRRLQEVDGMNLTLDETLGDANPHYSRVKREQIAAQEAALTVMEARKAAMVEASWSRILQAARIQSRGSEALLRKAEENAAEAFEAALAMGVTMYDIPNLPTKGCKVETSSANGCSSMTHTVGASFETAFEVDKQVASAVRTALIRLANCPSFNKDEFQLLLRKICQNPDKDESYHEQLDSCSECETDTGSDVEPEIQEDQFSNIDPEVKQKRHKRRQVRESFNMTRLVDMMLERLKTLTEDELASLATIVATCGLNAALAEVENTNKGGEAIKSSDIEYFENGQASKKRAESEVPGLDKYLVRHMSKLEREVMEAKNTRSNGSKNDSNLTIASSLSEEFPSLESVLVKQHSSKFEKEIKDAAKKDSDKLPEKKDNGKDDIALSSETDPIPELESLLVKRSSKLEREIEEAKRNQETIYSIGKRRSSTSVRNGVVSYSTEVVPELPGLDKFLVKRVSRLEREVLEAREQRKNGQIEGGKVTKKVDSNPKSEGSARFSCYNKAQAEKENVGFLNKEELCEDNEDDGGLCQVLVKHKPRHESERMEASSKEEPKEETRMSVSRREARERELQEAWGGLSLGNSIRPRLSRLERDKAAWIKAEEEERRKAMEEG